MGENPFLFCQGQDRGSDLHDPRKRAVMSMTQEKAPHVRERNVR